MHESGAGPSPHLMGTGLSRLASGCSATRVHRASVAPGTLSLSSCCSSSSSSGTQGKHGSPKPSGKPRGAVLRRSSAALDGLGLYHAWRVDEALPECTRHRACTHMTEASGTWRLSSSSTSSSSSRCGLSSPATGCQETLFVQLAGASSMHMQVCCMQMRI
jgi:hypothetical protein